MCVFMFANLKSCVLPHDLSGDRVICRAEVCARAWMSH